MRTLRLTQRLAALTVVALATTLATMAPAPDVGTASAAVVSVWDTAATARPVAYPLVGVLGAPVVVVAPPTPEGGPLGPSAPHVPGAQSHPASSPAAVAGPTRRPPALFGASGADRCRLVCVFRL